MLKELPDAKNHHPSKRRREESSSLEENCCSHSALSMFYESLVKLREPGNVADQMLKKLHERNF